MVYEDDVFEISGNSLEFYIVGVSTSPSRGQFRVKTWVEKDVAPVDTTVYTPPGVDPSTIRPPLAVTTRPMPVSQV